jgi:hypothetical protein
MFKYFIYISDSKVDMLLSQIAPEAKAKIATEAKIDLQVLSISRKSERDSGPDRIARLNLVANFIDEFGDVGLVDEPGEFFRGRLPMRWGAYGDSFVSSASEPLVYFGGSTDRTIIGLGGSAHHLIGNEGDSRPHSHSAMPYMISYLQAQLGSSVNAKSIPQDIAEGKDLALVAAHLATTGMTGSEQDLEFLARRLKYGPSPYPHRDPHPNMKVLLGTPLYVALAE